MSSRFAQISIPSSCDRRARGWIGERQKAAAAAGTLSQVPRHGTAPFDATDMKHDKAGFVKPKGVRDCVAAPDPVSRTVGSVLSSC